MSISEFFNVSIPSKPDQRLRLGNLQQDSLALVLNEIANRHAGVILAITPDNLTANRLLAAVKFFSPELSVLSFPDWETLPYDHFSPHQDIISQRLSTLAQLRHVDRALLLVPITTLMQVLAPTNYIQSTSLLVACGEKRRIEELRQNLQLGGYHSVSQVLTRGEFAVRGSILDIFPMGSDLPYRIDFVDDEVDSIRYFDPDTQRSIEKLEKIEFLPAREFPLSELAINCFRQQWRENFTGNPLNCPLYAAVSQGHAPAGIEYYLPLFFSKTQLLIDYLPKATLILQINDIRQSADCFWQEINQRYEQLRHDLERPILAPKRLYVGVNELFVRLKEFPRILLQQTPSDLPQAYHLAVKRFPNLTIEHKLEQPLARLNTFLSEFLVDRQARVLFCVESAGRREALLDLLAKLAVKAHRCETWHEFVQSAEPVHITVAPLEEGFYLETPPWALITEAQLFGNQVIQKRQTKTKSLDSRTIVRNLTELTEGAPVVHIDHGVGRYRGLQHLKVADQEN